MKSLDNPLFHGFENRTHFAVIRRLLRKAVDESRYIFPTNHIEQEQLDEFRRVIDDVAEFVIRNTSSYKIKNNSL